MFPAFTVGLVIFLGFSAAALKAQKPLEIDETLFLDFSIPSTHSAAEDLQPSQVEISLGKKNRELTCLIKVDPSSFALSNPNSWIVINQIRGEQALVFLLDLNSLDPVSLENAKSIIKSLVSSLDDGSRRFMLVSLGSQLRFLQSFTSDSAKFLAGLDSVASNQPRLDYKTLISELANIFTIQYRQDKDQALEEAIREGNIFLNEIRNRTEASVEGLGMFADWFETLSGPKNVLLFSAGYPVNPAPVVQDILRTYNEAAGPGISPSQRSARVGGGDDNVSPGDTASSLGQPDSMSQGTMSSSLLSAKMGSDRETVSSEDLRNLVVRLNRRQITIHAFDSRDVRADSLTASGITELPSQLVGRHNSSHITAGKEFLREITSPTGGSLIASEGDIIQMAAHNRGLTTYLAGIKIDKKRKLEEAQLDAGISIKGTGDDLAPVSHRATPFSLDEVSSDENLAGVFNFPEYHHDFSASFDYSVDGDEITGSVSVSPRELGFVIDNNSYLCMLEVFGLLTDSQGNPVTGNKKYTFAKQFPLRMDAGQYKSFLARDSVSASASATGITPGNYVLTMVARQPRTGLLAASKIPVSF